MHSRLVSTDRSEVQRAVSALVLLGPDAVPEMIRRIDDRRRMAVHAIAFRDRSPQAFEAAVQYEVQEVVDCLHHILSASTGERFGLIDLMARPGVTKAEMQNKVDAQRASEVEKWRGYLARSRGPRVPG
jgi:hypothetical protein